MTGGRVAHVVYDTPWAILPAKLGDILALLEMRASGVRLSATEIRARIGEPPPPRRVARTGTTAVVPIFGVLAQRMNLMLQSSGGTSLQEVAGAVRDARADAQVSTVVLAIDSCGGSCYGVTELCAEIRATRACKPVLASIDSTAASAAYWIAASATEVIVTPSGEVGSVGVLAAHEDVSKAQDMAGVTTTLVSAGNYKTEGNPFMPLTAEGRDQLQRRVDDHYQRFVADVALGRGVSVETVERHYGQGRMLSAEAALAVGMVDRIDSFHAVLARVAQASAPDTRLQATADPLWCERMQLEL